MRDPGAMAEHIRTILQAPAEQGRRMSAAAACQGARYDLSRQGQALLAWYQEIKRDFSAPAVP